MSKRLMLLMTVLMMAALFVIPAAAQDDDETLDYIAAAFDGVSDLETYRVTGDFIVTQTLEAEGMTIPTNLTQAIDARIGYEDGETVALDANLVQDIEIDLGIAGGSQAGAMTLDMRIVDGEVYLRVSEPTGIFVGQFTDAWQILGESGADAITQAFGNPDDLIASFNQQLLYPIDSDTVTELTELGEVDVDGETLLGFELEMDVEAAFSSEDMGALLGGTMDTSALGMTPEELMGQLLDGAELTLTVYISEEDDLVRRVESLVIFDASITAMNMEMDIEQSAEGLFTYSEFNEPFEVEAPE